MQPDDGDTLLQSGVTAMCFALRLVLRPTEHPKNRDDTVNLTW